MALVTLLGSFVLVTSRNERQAASNPLKSEKPRPPSLPGQKQFAGDHWHAALGIYICSEFAPNIQSDNDPRGIHTHGDGLVHIHPFTRASSGRNATFGVYAETVGLKVSASRVQVPGGKNYANGDKCPDGKAGKIRVFLNGDERDGNPTKIRLRDRDKLVIAFAPAGADIPKDPPSASELDSVSDLPVTSTTVPGGASTTAPGTEGTTDTTAATTDSTAATTTPTTAATTSSSSP